MPRREAGVGNVASDEPGPAGDDDPHGRREEQAAGTLPQPPSKQEGKPQQLSETKPGSTPPPGLTDADFEGVKTGSEEFWQLCDAANHGADGLPTY